MSTIAFGFWIYWPNKALTLEAPIVVAGYAYFANKIKNGEFNPTNIVGKAIKNGIEKVMYMGMNKEEIENERGKTRW